MVGEVISYSVGRETSWGEPGLMEWEDLTWVRLVLGGKWYLVGESMLLL